jgi:Rieske Fe-S protein
MALSRRSLLKTSATCTAAAALLPAGCGYDVDAAPTISAKLDDVPTSAKYGQIRVLFADHPELRSVGAAAILDLGALPARERPFTVPEGGVLLVHRSTDESQFVAVSALCQHAGCPLGYTSKEQLIGCPCHGSRFQAAFDCAGNVLRGPARGSLRSFGVTIDAQGVTVDLNQRGACSMGFTPTVDNGQVVLPFAQVPELASAGGSYVTLAITGLPGGLAVARVDASTARATSAACTHLQCPVQLQNQEWFCNCHFSRFDLSGAVKAGPATTPLTAYTATVGKDAITVKVA